jgi:competence protein ComGC
MHQPLKTKLAAFTIVESITAMIIIMISFSVVIMVYLNLMQTNAFPLKTKANNILDTLWIETQQESLYLDETIYVDGFQIRKEVSPYTTTQTLESSGLYQVTLSAISPNQEKIAVHNHLIQATYVIN